MMGIVTVLAIGAAATALSAAFGLAAGSVLHAIPYRVFWGGSDCHPPTDLARTTEARNAVDQFVVDEGRCPHSERELVDGRYLRTIAKDRHGLQLFYTCVAAGNDVEVTVRSAGLDRTFWTADDVVSSSP